MTELNEYDQFYRTVANPLNKMRVDHFVADLDKLVDECEEFVEGPQGNPKNNNGNADGGQTPVKYNRDYVSIVDFIDHYEEKSEWRTVLKDVDSPFLKILRLDDAFFNKRVVSQKSDNWRKIGSTVKVAKTLQTPTSASTLQQKSEYDDSINTTASPSKISKGGQKLEIPPHEKRKILQMCLKMNMTQKVDFDPKTSVYKMSHDDKDMQIKINIDVQLLKVFALLMCKGSLNQKAGIFFDLAVGSEGVK